MSRPWVKVPPELSAAMDGWARQCQALAEAWATTAAGRVAGVMRNSPSAHDVRALAERLPPVQAPIANTPGNFAGEYASAIAQHLQAVAALLTARQVTVSVWPLVRAELEIAGRIAWLLEGFEDGSVSAEQRLARALMEAHYSVCQRGLHDTNLDPSSAPAAKDIGELFESAVVTWARLRDESRWQVGGERWMGQTASVKQFTGREFGDPALYSWLSAVSHPSLLELRRQSRTTTVDGFTWTDFEVLPAALEQRTRIACRTLYTVGRRVAAYFGLPMESLEAWADGAPAGWLTTSEASG